MMIPYMKFGVSDTEVDFDFHSELRKEIVTLKGVN